MQAVAVDEAVGLVDELWRYPVKSMLGEAVGALELGLRGAEGDRAFAVCDAEGKLGSGKSTRRMRRMEGLFRFAAHLVAGEDVPRVMLPGGEVLSVGDPRLDEALTRALGIDVSVRAEQAISHFDDSPIHLVTQASLRWLRGVSPDSRVDARRFRPNLVVDAGSGARPEEEWIGRTLAVGDSVRLRVHGPTERCVMTTMEQADLPDDPAILRAVARENEACFGVYADVVAPGRVARGDTVRVLR